MLINPLFRKIFGKPWWWEFFGWLFEENKKILVIGPINSGKTCLINWLVHENLLKEYIPTMVSITNISDLFVKNEYFDTAGTEFNTNNWNKFVKDEKFKRILYLFDMEKFLKDKDYEKQIYNQIGLLTEHFKVDSKLIIIGTRLDKFNYNKDKVQMVINDLRNEIDIGSSKIIYGSLINHVAADDLKKQIFKIIKD